MSELSDKELGLHLPIDRRNFIGGMAVVAALGSSAGALAQGMAAAAPAPASPDYPPALTGLRGQYPGSFEAAHMARKTGGALVQADDERCRHISGQSLGCSNRSANAGRSKATVAYLAAGLSKLTVGGAAISASFCTAKLGFSE